MKRLILAVFIIIFINIIVVKFEPGQVDMEGIVLDINDQGIELARNITAEEYEEIKDEPATTLHNEDVEGKRDLGLIELTYENKDELNKGDEVKVWIDGDIMTSYPPQAKAKKISLKK